MSTEKRRFSRIVFNVRASLEAQKQKLDFDRIVNLSVGGCLLEITDRQPRLKRSQEVVFKIYLDHDAPLVTVTGEITRLEDTEIGVKFTGIDPDSLYHLHNIIRYNAKDPDLIEKEIDEHPGLK